MNRRSVSILCFVSGLLLLMLFTGSCRQRSVPKPRGYYRIDFPEKEYQTYSGDCPYRFEFPVYGRVVPDQEVNSEPCWINIEFPGYNGIIHISYKEVSNNLGAFLEDAHTLAYKHSVKADAINEMVIQRTEERVFGIFYEIEGDVASSVQFYLTDSTRHYLRGALYFRTQVNKDSLRPVINFFKEDIFHFIDTFEWN